MVENADRTGPAGWASRLRAIAQTARDTGFPDGVARGFAAWRRVADGEHTPPSAERWASTPSDEPALDDALWLALAGAPLDVGGALERGRPAPGGFGALVEQGLFKTIEVWTETELSALQALWRLGLARDDAALTTRAHDAARWCLDHLQPDNGTNRPWGAAVFAHLESIDGGGAAGLYAETLVQNCVAMNGAPDGLSAAILIDGAEGLRALVG
jgi:hypothetical protein